MHRQDSVGHTLPSRMFGLAVVLLTVFSPVISLASLSCYDCHGTRSPADYRPLDTPQRDPVTGGFRGNHRNHLAAGATPATCDRCHPGSAGYDSGHRDGLIKLAANINGSPRAATYSNRTSTFPQVSSPSPGSCSNVNCHFETVTSEWGSEPLAAPAGCSTCHGAPPADGSHPAAAGSGKGHADYYGTTDSCGKCHPDHTTFAHATSAGKRGLDIRFTAAPNVQGRYSGVTAYPAYLPSQNPSRTGACSQLYCHSNGKDGVPNVVPVWGGTLPPDCTGCHGGNAASALSMTSGNHVTHLAGGVGCGRCHNATVQSGDDRTVTGRASHLDGSKTLQFSEGGDYDAAGKTCTGVYCHSNGGGGAANTVPSWGGALPADCSGCHGGDAASASPIASGTHRSHMNNYTTLGTGNSFDCTVCHAATVDGNRHVASNRHADGLKDYSGARAGRIATAGSGQCSNNYCHSTGMRGNRFWSMTAANWYSGRTLGCTGCHGTPVLPDGTFAAFTSVAGEPNYANLTGIGQRNSHRPHVRHAATPDTTVCASCHDGTVDSAVPNRLRANSAAHLNVMRDVAFPAAIQGRFSSTTQQCVNTYCHGTAATTPPWGGPSLACTGCHSAENSGFAASGAGAHELHYQTATVPAPGSYGTMAAANIGTADRYQFSCTSCHASPAVHAGGRGDVASGASAQVYFGYTAGGLKGSYRYAAVVEPATDKGFRWSAGQCSATYCHSNGNGGFGNVTTLAWTSPAGSLGNDCSGCHGGNRQSGRPLATNAHPAHMNNDAVIGVSFGCVECHARTVGSDRTIADKRLHVNRLKDYSGARAGGRANYDPAARQCSNVFCHSNGKQGTAVAAYANPPAWNSGSTLGCNGCHGPGNEQGAPDYASGDEGSATANSHVRHAANNTVSANIPCMVCHSMTASGSTAIRGDRNPSLHLNAASNDVYFNMSGTYVNAAKSCTTIYCHSNGAPFDKPAIQKGVTWGGASQVCTSCHDGGGGATGLSGRHGRHTDLSTYGFNCELCHNDTATGSTAIKERTRHVNRVKDVAFQDGGSYDGTRGCNATYCHSDARGGAPTTPVTWSDTNNGMKCYSCHKGRTVDSTQADCASIQGVWSSGRGYCTPPLTMSSNGHERLVGLRWIRKYPCTYCHTATVPAVTPIPGKPPVDDASRPVILGRYTAGSFIPGKHVNRAKDIAVNSFWKIDGNRNSYAAPSYNPTTRSCDNLYCHSDGTTDPTQFKELKWDSGERTKCNSCHGHAQGECRNCHNGVTVVNGRVLASYTSWTRGDEWKSAMPMFANEGVNMPRANSHMRHLETSFSCSECHNQTVINGDCGVCHQGGVSGNMGETSHLNPAIHVNKLRDVNFRQGGTYNAQTTGTKSCSNTRCHSGDDPVWGMSITSEIICLSCHGSTSQTDQDDFGSFNNTKARINLTEWKDTGHGRTSDKGAYRSGNPPANFPGNPCWYCHDNAVLHKDAVNPFRLKMHSQFNNRFDHECVYCHMARAQEECLDCHNAGESMAPKLANITSSHIASDTWLDGTPVIRPDHRGMQSVSCMTDQDATNLCHSSEMRTHNTGAGVWTVEQKADVKNQYMMMGVCLQCHDDDANGKCNGCHSAADPKYQLGYNPGTGFIKPVKARASSVHFGHKHYQGFLASGGWEWDPNRYGTGKGGYKGVWKGGKFCWDCHDPHGDGNLYMVQDMVATETDGRFGIPVPEKRARVRFTQKNTGADYAKTSGTIDGICNVCHLAGSQHYRNDGGDGHNASYVCTKCHEHRFSDSHGGSHTCNYCHLNKPVPRHSAFGLPRDCTKCHAGNVGARVDIMGQFKGNSHHVQGVAVTNEQCYQCHWEATEQGLIDVAYHEGYNYKTYSTVKNAKVDLVVYGPGFRPGAYRLSSSAQGRATAVQFTAANVSSPNINTERKEVAKITDVCISCHSDQNNDATPFNDCKTPRQYAWDRQSIAARYAEKKTARWSNYSTATTSGKFKIKKAYSAHGRAADNQGGWDPTTGVDAAIANTRAGFAGMSSARQSVQCFDCHNSHGSKASGVTSSYVNFTGMQNGGNLKEVTSGKGGYTMTYSAKGKANGTGVVNPYNAGAGQCFDCHMTAARGTTPWGYNSTFGATQPIKGYRDALRFGQRTSAVYKLAATIKKDRPIVGGHLKASGTDQGNGPKTPIMGTINGLCTPCHDPHGISPSLGDNRVYAIPMLRDTWLTSPYREDQPPPNPSGTNATALSYGKYQGHPYDAPAKWYKYNTDRTTFGSGRIAESEEQFAGLCLRCHPKKSLLGNYTGAVNTATNASNAPWGSTPRVHASVKEWGKNKVSGEHANPCSKCHQPHNSALPRLMQTNCLNSSHRGNRPSGGQAWKASSQEYRANSEGEYRGYPAGNLLGNSAAVEATVTCHSAAQGNTGSWPGRNLWNSVTPW